MESRFMEDAKERVYALYMGLTMEKFEQLDYAEGDETSNDGTVYYHWIQLRSGNPPAVIDRIKHRDGDRYGFHLPVSIT